MMGWVHMVPHGPIYRPMGPMGGTMDRPWDPRRHGPHGKFSACPAVAGQASPPHWWGLACAVLELTRVLQVIALAVVRRQVFLPPSTPLPSSWVWSTCASQDQRTHHHVSIQFKLLQISPTQCNSILI